MASVNVAPLGRTTRFGTVAFGVFIVAMLVASGIPALAGPVTVTNLITDDQSANPALLTDPNLINAWGVSFPPGGPLGLGRRQQPLDDLRHRSGHQRPDEVWSRGVDFRQSDRPGVQWQRGGVQRGRVYLRQRRRLYLRLARSAGHDRGDTSVGFTR